MLDLGDNGVVGGECAIAGADEATATSGFLWESTGGAVGFAIAFGVDAKGLVGVPTLAGLTFGIYSTDVSRPAPRGLC